MSVIFLSLFFCCLHSDIDRVFQLIHSPLLYIFLTFRLFSYSCSDFEYGSYYKYYRLTIFSYQCHSLFHAILRVYLCILTDVNLWYFARTFAVVFLHAGLTTVVVCSCSRRVLLTHKVFWKPCYAIWMFFFNIMHALRYRDVFVYVVWQVFCYENDMAVFWWQLPGTLLMPKVVFLSRVSTAMVTRDIDIGLLPVCRLSVCPSRSGTSSKRLNTSSQFVHHTVAQSL